VNMLESTFLHFYKPVLDLNFTIQNDEKAVLIRLNIKGIASRLQ